MDKSTHSPYERPVLDVYKEQRDNRSPRIAARAREGTDEEITVLYPRRPSSQDEG